MVNSSAKRCPTCNRLVFEWMRNDDCGEQWCMLCWADAHKHLRRVAATVALALETEESTPKKLAEQLRSALSPDPEVQAKADALLDEVRELLEGK